MEFYYDPNTPTSELTARMERVLKRQTRKSKKCNTETKE